jgi:hypothetical protein
MQQCIVSFPAQWVNASRFETALRSSCGPHDAGTFEVTFEFPTNCKVMVDAAIRLLSLANQLAFATRRVRLHFEEGEAGTMGYLNRMGFFDHLRADVEVLPARPAYSGAEIHRGGNQALVEIAQINKDARALIPYLGLDETRSEAIEALINQARTDADMTNSKCSYADTDAEAALICALFNSAPARANPLVSRTSLRDTGSAAII